jgi:hypothetical protein
MVNLSRVNSEIVVSDIIAALSRVMDKDGKPLFKTIQMLSDLDWQPVTVETSPAVFIDYVPSAMIFPAVQNVNVEELVRLNLYYVIFASEGMNPTFQLNRVQVWTTFYLELAGAGDSMGMLPSTKTNGGFIWAWKPDAYPNTPYSDSTTVPRAGQFVPVGDNCFVRMQELPPCQILQHNIQANPIA